MGSKRHKRLARFLFYLTAVFWYSSLVYTVWCAAPLAAIPMGWQGPAETVLDLPISVSYAEDSLADPASPDRVTVCSHSNVQVRVAEWGIAFGDALVNFICVVGLAVIAYQLREFVRRVAAGHPFEENNPLRVRNIGIVLAILGPLSAAWTTFAAYFYVDRISLPSATLHVTLMLGWENVVIGLLLILVGQVFTIGVVLQGEHDYTV